MPQFYRVLKADPLDGEYTPDKPGAKPLKSFWCQVEGIEEPVMMSKQVPNTPSLTEGHYGVLEQRTSAKGNAYWKFVGMQIPQGTSKPRYDGGVATHQQLPATQDTSEPAWFAPYAERIANLEKMTLENKGIDKDKLDTIFGADLELAEVPEE